MQLVSVNEIEKYVEKNIDSFHNTRLESLKELKLKKVLLRKNPYLFKAKNILLSQDLVKTLLDAHLSSQEETIFGDFLEGLSIFICNKAYGGNKSAAEGIDLEFKKDGVKYIVTIKSGPNWGNSSQINKMLDNFRKAKRILKTNIGKLNIVAVNGCCYGKNSNPDKGEYLKPCGQVYWEFISGSKDLYKQIVKPLGYKAKEKNDEFMEEYSKIINQFTKEFTGDFCKKDGSIAWDMLVEFNSAEDKK